jgi:hypothetical protein
MAPADKLIATAVIEIAIGRVAQIQKPEAANRLGGLSLGIDKNCRAAAAAGWTLMATSE